MTCHGMTDDKIFKLQSQCTGLKKKKKEDKRRKKKEKEKKRKRKKERVARRVANLFILKI